MTIQRPIRDQILWPLTFLLLAAIAANASFAAWWASSRTMMSLADRQNQIIAVLEESSFPLSTSVMEKLKRLTGDEFIVWDSVERRMLVGSLTTTESLIRDLEDATAATAHRQTINTTLGGTRYLIRTGRIRSAPSHHLLVLTSGEELNRASRSAVWPPLAVGTVTIILSAPLVMLLASGWSQRIRRLEKHVDTISSGEFGLELEPGSVDDELARLVKSINSMSHQLDNMQQELVRSERTRLIAQLAAGFAHQLRNGLAGVKLAIQLHQKRCQPSGDSSLTVACQQLTLVEEEVRGLLSLGKGEAKIAADVDLVDLINGIRNLVSPACQHQGVECHFEQPIDTIVVNGHVDGLRSAILNIVLNAIEATGSGGRVWIMLHVADGVARIAVEDDGPGPQTEISSMLFESFVTSKQEGVGLGLAVAAAVARDHHGTLEWARQNDRTRFELGIPMTVCEKVHS